MDEPRSDAKPDSRPDEKPDPGRSMPNLRAAVRRARLELAERSEVVGELRGAELARLRLLEEAFAPILAQVPEQVDLFDAGVAPGERPRLFIDMIAHVEMGHDRRTYRFVQETRHGRVTIAETDRIDVMVDALTDYVARRLVEREQALAADLVARAQAPAPAATPAQPGVKPADKTAETPGKKAPLWRRFMRGAAMFTIELVGSFVLFALIIVAAYAAWLYGPELWARLSELWR